MEPDKDLSLQQHKPDPVRPPNVTGGPCCDQGQKTAPVEFARIRGDDTVVGVGLNSGHP